MLTDPNLIDGISAEARATGWLGRRGATPEEIVRCEHRLGAIIPPSYRDFLLTSNGWGRLGTFIDHLWSAEEVGWFTPRHHHWIETLTSNPAVVPDELYNVYGDEQQTWAYRPNDLRDALEVSSERDGAILLLNPHTMTSEGEWEALFLASWYPGAKRYRSFLALMQGEYESYRTLREDE